MHRIYLVRHGETDWNRDQRLQGTLNVRLNEVGIEQGRRVAKRLSGLRVSRVYTSPLGRARHTALLLSRGRNWPVIVERLLREIDHGIWTGLTLGKIARDFPDELQGWRLRPDCVRPSGGESLQEAYGRAAGFLRGITDAAFDGDILIVSHGVINALLLYAASGAPLARVWESPQPNAHVTVLRAEDRKIFGIEEHEDDTD